MSSGSTAIARGSVEAAVVLPSDEANLNSTSSGMYQGSDPAGEIRIDTESDESADMSAQLLVGVIVGSVVLLAITVFMICARRQRYKPKPLSPSNFSAFQGAISTTATHNTLEVNATSTARLSPQAPRMQTFKLPPRRKPIHEEHITVDIGEIPPDTMPPTQTSRATNVRGGLRSPLSWFTTVGPSRSVEVYRDNPLSSMDSAASTISFARAESVPYPNGVSTTSCPTQRQTEGESWRDLSDTCWSIGPDSDSESEDESDERYPASVASRLNGKMIRRTRSRLSTLSDNTEDSVDPESDDDLDANSLDDSSRRRERAMNLSPLRERSISSLDDSSPRRIRGLSALDMLRKSNNADIHMNHSLGSYFSADSEFFDETIRDCSNLPCFDRDRDRDRDRNRNRNRNRDRNRDSDSDDSVLEQWF